MLLDVRQIEFANGNMLDAEGRMAWSVGPNSQTRFIVVRNPVLQDEDATWQCECPRGLPPRKISPTVCDHIHDAYLHWLNAEFKKRQMMEQVKQYTAAVKETKPIEPHTGFSIKPKRIINLED